MRLDSLGLPEKIGFGGNNFRRLGGKRKYYGGVVEGLFKGLHVAIWEAVNGPVPPNHEIHHKDHNTFNCEIDNLACLLTKEHRRHSKNIDMVAQTAHLDRVRPLAAVWHRSEEGRAWHARVTMKHLEKAWAALAERGLPFKDGGVCVWCGGPFQFRNCRKKTCSAVCHSQHKAFRAGKRKTANAYFLANFTA